MTAKRIQQEPNETPKRRTRGKALSKEKAPAETPQAD